MTTEEKKKGTEILHGLSEKHFVRVKNNKAIIE